MARIVRHNDESVREGNIRNGGKEVNLFTSALKAFQSNNRIVMAQRKHLDDFLHGRIIGRLECGHTQLEVSEELGIAQSVISRLWQRFQDDVTAKRNRRNTASDLSRQLSSATGTTVSRQTVYRRLGKTGLYARRSVRCVPLTATHCRLRLTWSREHALWIPQQWSCVMFSDESRFSLQSDSHRTLIWRAPGTRYHQENTIERHRYGGAGWLVWGGIILGSRTDLHVQSVTMTGHIYRDVILEQHVRLFRGTMGAEFLFMDDNARSHRTNIVDECLQLEDISRMDWPAYSPDLNPIEHVWDILGRRIAARQPPPTCLLELRRALLNEWCNIPQDQIDNLILSMSRRCKACIASSGRHTPY
ncbi:transposable element Tcb1 transposase [Trichonephila clavipes]|uniref:Transposable element Tcb1 transposase n=1 Tax=Trichonephila clavipes TaxID=2585209 RepID=A0A8X6W1D1_TRICX|nr:transposable element Tcb1 transposase [Trichonephila clavipes]